MVLDSRRRACLVLVTLVALACSSAACDADGGTAPPAGPERGASDGRRAPFTEVAAVDLPFPEVGGLELDGPYVVFVHAEDGASTRLDELDHVGVVDWRTGELRHLYTTSFPDGRVSSVDVEGDWVVVSEDDRVPWVGDEATRWRLLAMRVDGSGSPRELSRSPGLRRSWPPLPNANVGRFVWTELEEAGDPLSGLRVRSWTPGEQVRDVARRLKVNVAAPVTDGVVLAQPARRPDGSWGADLSVLEDGADRPAPLTHGALTSGLEVDGDLVAWTRVGVRPDGRPAASDFTGSIWSTRLDGSAPPAPVFEGPLQGRVTPGAAGFVAFWDRRLRVTLTWPGLDEPLVAGRRGVDVPASMDADGNHLVYATRERGRLRIRVLEVSPAVP